MGRQMSGLGRAWGGRCQFGGVYGAADVRLGVYLGRKMSNWGAPVAVDAKSGVYMGRYMSNRGRIKGGRCLMWGVRGAADVKSGARGAGSDSACGF